MLLSGNLCRRDPDRVQPFLRCLGNLEARLSTLDIYRDPPATSFDGSFRVITRSVTPSQTPWRMVSRVPVGNTLVPELHVRPPAVNYRAKRCICNTPIIFHSQSVPCDLDH
jgi:hypothetical protein